MRTARANTRGSRALSCRSYRSSEWENEFASTLKLIPIDFPKDPPLSTTHEVGGKNDSVCVGILAADPLRSIGLQSILEDGLKLQTVILPDERRPRSLKPTIVIVEEGMDAGAGLPISLSELLARLPGVSIVVLTRTENPLSAQKALASGARAVLPETADISDIRACIRAVMRGKTWIPREAEVDGQTNVPPAAGKDAGLAERFTPKESEVLRWLAQGHSNREIASTMGIDEATVKAHLGRMLRKAAATNRVELTLRALAEQRRQALAG